MSTEQMSEHHVEGNSYEPKVLLEMGLHEANTLADLQEVLRTHRGEGEDAAGGSEDENDSVTDDREAAAESKQASD